MMRVSVRPSDYYYWKNVYFGRPTKVRWDKQDRLIVGKSELILANASEVYVPPEEGLFVGLIAWLKVLGWTVLSVIATVVAYVVVGKRQST